MLISCRKEGESVQIGEQIEVRVISVRKNKVTLGVVAPRDIKIATRKLSEMEMVNTMAAVQSIDVGEWIGIPRQAAESIMFVLEKAKTSENTLVVADKTDGSPDE